MKKQYCTTCGTPNQFGVNFCGSCGSPFSSFTKKKTIVKKPLLDEEYEDDDEEDYEEIKSNFKNFDFSIEVIGPKKIKIGEAVGTSSAPLTPNNKSVTKKQVKEALQIYKKLASNNERSKENDL